MRPRFLPTRPPMANVVHCAIVTAVLLMVALVATACSNDAPLDPRVQALQRACVDAGGAPMARDGLVRDGPWVRCEFPREAHQ